MKVDGATNFELLDDCFVYKGKSFKYSDIRSIRFNATVTKHSVNFIPTGKSYDGTLEINLRSSTTVSIRPDTNWVGGMRERGLNALHQIKEILSDITFNQRLDAFEEEVKNKGFFSYGRYQFHRNGDLFRDRVYQFNLKDPSVTLGLSIFELHVNRKRTGLGRAIKLVAGDDENINIEQDRDCFLYMMKHHIGFTWKNEIVRDRSIDKRRIFYEAVIKIGAIMATADGEVDSEEISQLKRFFKIDSDSFPDAAQILNEALRSRPSVEAVINPFKEAFNDAPQVCESFLVGMLSVALADGVLHDGELSILRRVSALLGISDVEFKRIFASVGVDISDSAKSSSERDRLLAVLGLGAKASYADVLSAWRALVRRYHPDILRGQCLPEDEIRHAERLLAEINVAHEKLRTIMAAA